MQDPHVRELVNGAFNPVNGLWNYVLFRKELKSYADSISITQETWI